MFYISLPFMPDTIKLKPIVPTVAGLAAGLALLVGCTAQNPNTDEAESEPGEELNQDEKSLAAEAGFSLLGDTSLVSNAEAPDVPAPSYVSGGFAASASAEGVPTKDAYGNPIDTITGLTRAVDYYNRYLRTYIPSDEDEEKNFKPFPPLKSLQQLVEYKLIRAVPKAPDGKKYVYDEATATVKMVDQ